MLGLTQTRLQYVFFYVGLAHTTGVKASIPNGTGTFFSVLLALFSSLFLGEEVRAWR